MRRHGKQPDDLKIDTFDAICAYIAPEEAPPETITGSPGCLCVDHEHVPVAVLLPSVMYVPGVTSGPTWKTPSPGI